MSKGTRSILDYFPYEEMRDVQRDALLELESNWGSYDVFVIMAPTATGKSAIARTIMNWQGDVAMIVPSNLLVDQFRAEFSGTLGIKRADLYQCTDSGVSCHEMGRILGSSRKRTYCRGCKYSSDFRGVVYGKQSALVCNYHMLFAMRLHRRVLVVDEAHNLIPVTADLARVRLWEHKVGYPHRPGDRDGLREWTYREMSAPRGLSKSRRKAIDFLAEALDYEKPQYVLQWTEDTWTGGGVEDERGLPVKRGVGITLPCLDLVPVDIRDLDQRKWFFPPSVEKVVLMSATISRKDIEQLGLSRKRVLYIQCESPIPPERRPVIIEPVVSVNRGNLRQATEDIGRYIEEALLPRHVGEKGLVHATYEQTRYLRSVLSGDRTLFHDNMDKHIRYQEFRETSADSGTLLISAGMYEGIDLPYDAGRWQVVAKVPWKSLADPAVRYLAERDPEWYIWETLKQLIQAFGRISRTPDDYGITYCLDGSVERLLRDGWDMVPEWLRSALYTGYE